MAHAIRKRERATATSVTVGQPATTMVVSVVRTVLKAEGSVCVTRGGQGLSVESNFCVLIQHVLVMESAQRGPAVVAQDILGTHVLYSSKRR